MVKYFQKFSKWVYRGMGESFLLGILRGCPKALQNTLLVFLEISQNSQENTGTRVSFLIKLVKRDSGTGVFL